MPASIGFILARMSRFDSCPRFPLCAFLCAIATWVVPGAAPAQQPSPAERASPLLSITFAAVTGDGVPVADLTAADVSVKLDGRSRPVRSLQLVSVSTASGGGSLLPPPFGSNAITTRGRSVLLIVDDESFVAGGEQALRQAAERLLSALSRADRIALVSIPHGGVNIAPTTDRTRIRTALATLVGRGDSRQTGSDLACRTRLTLETLAHQLRAVRAPDGPTVIAFLTAGLAAPRRDAPATMAPGMCELRLDTFRDVGDAAGRARAQFYLVPPIDIMSTGSVGRENIAGVGVRGSDNPVEGIEQLLAVTGGTLINLGAGDRTAFDRIVAESGSYYVATIEPQRSDRGRAHSLEVRVARGGVDVRGPRSITFVESEDRAGTASAPSPRDMLSTMAEFRDLPLRAAAYSSMEEPGGKIRVIVLAEPAEPGVKLVSVMAALFDRDGKGVASWTAQADDLERAPVLGAVAAPSGAYRMRVAAIDATGRSGTADYDVDVDLARTGPLKISAILLGLSRSGSFVPKLQFEHEPVAIAYVEMMGAPPGARVAATLELSETANGPALISVPLTIESGGADRYVAKGSVAIGGIPPGDYAVRAMVGLEGHPMTRVVRTLRKVVPAAR